MGGEIYFFSSRALNLLSLILHLWTSPSYTESGLPISQVDSSHPGASEKMLLNLGELGSGCCHHPHCPRPGRGNAAHETDEHLRTWHKLPDISPAVWLLEEYPMVEGQ